MTRETVAHASGRKPNDRRWTELAIYHEPAGSGTGSGSTLLPFVAEIIGETQMEGEVRRERRQRFRTVASALAWQAFDNRSALFDQLRSQAINWMEALAKRKAGDLVVEPGDGRLIGVAMTGLTSPAGTAQPIEGEPGVQWGGDVEAGDFVGALAWLYEPLGIEHSERVARFARDWDHSVQNVLEALRRSGTVNLQPWADTFCRAMRHFDREGFHAARNG